jgi:hypothetical protein
VTERQAVEFRIDARLVQSAPVPGSMYRLPTRAGTVLLVSKVARVIERQVLVAYRLTGSRLRAATLPPGTEPLPWPKARGSVGRPRGPAEPPEPTERAARPIQTRQQQQSAERKRITQRRREHAADPANQMVDPIRRQNRTALEASWRDPADVDVLRRGPKTVSGFRAATRSPKARHGPPGGFVSTMKEVSFSKKAVSISVVLAAADLNPAPDPPNTS